MSALASVGSGRALAGASGRRWAVVLSVVVVVVWVVVVVVVVVVVLVLVVVEDDVEGGARVWRKEPAPRTPV
jgi:hypothetical protein